MIRMGIKIEVFWKNRERRSGRSRQETGAATKEPKDGNGKVSEVVTTTQAPAIIPTSTSTSTSVAMASSGNQINDG
ncbi:hypothetical protein WR25_20710 [Diploscapter pachys]|uniref:Uncharacterized protein n=1 Tax=Diploscapter pachys TaxID=2018661 RepID=A0A2A2J6K4_9BILA|nr:hypothetical protein WR25_20710 [Diploscapter pachys]